MIESIKGLIRQGCTLFAFISLTGIAGLAQASSQSKPDERMAAIPQQATDPGATLPKKSDRANVPLTVAVTPAITWLPMLTPGAKIKYGARAALLNPGAYFGPALSAYFTERNELRVTAKTRKDYFADGLSFYARFFARQATSDFLASGVYPALFRQDPRYYAAPKSGVGARLLYAVSRTVFTRNDEGRTQYNYSKLAGFLTSTALANAYERDTARTRNAQGRIIRFNERTGSAATFRNFGFLVMEDVIGNVFFNEFHLDQKLGQGLKKVFKK